MSDAQTPVPAMTLGERQELFSKLIADHILWLYSQGYTVRCGDFQAIRRDPLEHKAKSNHYIKCAADLNLFKLGVYLPKTEDHKASGEMWETRHPRCRWGGRYNDGNHYELN
jgi:hypothetical protein